MIEYVYDPDASERHAIGTVERLANGFWRASTRRVLIGSTFADRDEAIAAVHNALDGEGAS